MAMIPKDIRINHPRKKITTNAVRISVELSKRLQKAGLSPVEVSISQGGWHAEITFEEDARQALLLAVVQSINRMLHDMGNITVLDVTGRSNKNGAVPVHRIVAKVKLHKGK
jgi:hypothetical protein